VFCFSFYATSLISDFASFYGKSFVCPSVTLRYRDHIGWNSSKIVSRLINWNVPSLGPQVPNITDLLQREHPKISTQSDPPPFESQTFDSKCGRMVWVSAMVTTEPTGNHHRSFQWYDRWPLRPPLPSKLGSKCTSRDMSNFESPYLRNGSFDPVHVWF